VFYQTYLKKLNVKNSNQRTKFSIISSSVGVSFIAIIHLIKNAKSNKKQRVLKQLKKYYEQHENSVDYQLFSMFENFTELNSHDILFVVASISASCALTYEESFKLANELGFYHNESVNYKDGSFNKHFKYILASINANFQMLI